MRGTIGIFLALGLLGSPALAQSLPQEVSVVLQGNPAIPKTLVERLSQFFEAAFDEGLLSASQALELLGAVGWETLSPESDVGFATKALELALVALGAGLSYEEVLGKLQEALASAGMSPLSATKVDGRALPSLLHTFFGNTVQVEYAAQIMEEVGALLAAKIPLKRIGERLRASLAVSTEEMFAAPETLEPHRGPPSFAPLPPSQGNPDEEEKPGRGHKGKG
ncbi:MAG: hypothetical protein ACP5JD_05800 [Candidatus Bipolaricaulaceae bacterium]